MANEPREMDDKMCPPHVEQIFIDIMIEYFNGKWSVKGPFVVGNNKQS